MISWITGDKLNGPDVHPGPVLDLRLADLRPPRRHATPSHRRAGPADGAGPDRDLGLQQQRRPSTATWSRTRPYITRAARQHATCSPTPSRTARRLQRHHSNHAEREHATITVTVNVVAAAADGSIIVDYPIIYVDQRHLLGELLAVLLVERQRLRQELRPAATSTSRGNYSSSVTIAAANDIIIEGSVTTNLARDRGDRHGRQQLHPGHARRDDALGRPPRASAARPPTSPAQTLTQHADRRRDAGAQPLVHRRQLRLRRADRRHPAERRPDRQRRRSRSSSAARSARPRAARSVTGYLKNYTYDDRLEVQQPPYLFDLASASWRVVRETAACEGSDRRRSVRLLDARSAAGPRIGSAADAREALHRVRRRCRDRQPRDRDRPPGPARRGLRDRALAVPRLRRADRRLRQRPDRLLARSCAGRCRHCGEPISPRYPLTEAGLGRALGRDGAGAGYRRRRRARPRASCSARS